MEREIELPRSRDAAVAARRFLDSHAGQVGEAALEDARLIVSELVTNALLHGRGRIFLTVRVDDACLRVEVGDEAPARRPRSATSPMAGAPGAGDCGSWTHSRCGGVPSRAPPTSGSSSRSTEV